MLNVCIYVLKTKTFIEKTLHMQTKKENVMKFSLQEKERKKRIFTQKIEKCIIINFKRGQLSIYTRGVNSPMKT